MTICDHFPWILSSELSKWLLNRQYRPFNTNSVKIRGALCCRFSVFGAAKRNLLRSSRKRGYVSWPGNCIPRCNMFNIPLFMPSYTHAVQVFTRYFLLCVLGRQVKNTFIIYVNETSSFCEENTSPPLFHSSCYNAVRAPENRRAHSANSRYCDVLCTEA